MQICGERGVYVFWDKYVLTRSYDLTGAQYCFRRSGEDMERVARGVDDTR